MVVDKQPEKRWAKIMAAIPPAGPKPPTPKKKKKKKKKSKSQSQQKRQPQQGKKAKRAKLKSEVLDLQGSCCFDCGERIDPEEIQGSWMVRNDFHKSDGNETIQDVRVICRQCNGIVVEKRKDHYWRLHNDDLCAD